MSQNKAGTTRYPLSLRPLHAAIVAGLPLAAIALVATRFAPFGRELFDRYLAHPLEQVELALFCCGMGVFIVKLWSLRSEWQALDKDDWLPAHNGAPLAAGEAASMARHAAAAGMEQTWLARRYANALGHVARRRSAAGLDEHLRGLADADAMTLEGSASLTRFITWAIPILGFLGTVLGITGAISGVTPEKLEASLSTVTDGLARAFDATAVALALTMVLMFTASMVERAETRVLEEVDGRVDRDLPPRFETAETAGSETASAAGTAARAVAEVMSRQFSHLANEIAGKVHEAVCLGLARVAEQTMAIDRSMAIRMEESRQFLDRSAATADQMFRAHHATLAEMGAQVARQVAAPVDALERIRLGMAELSSLQALLAQNLGALSQGNSLEEVLHQLSAATHLLAAKATRMRDAQGVEAGHGLAGPRAHASAARAAD
ncbi:MAG: MotA/TolQ/ExbB proton channel family protein [Planctomycetota bacterium]